jgi:hypothetical protein
MRSTTKAIAVTTRRRVRPRVLDKGVTPPALLLLHDDLFSVSDRNGTGCDCCLKVGLLACQGTALHGCSLQLPTRLAFVESITKPLLEHQTATFFTHPMQLSR